MIVPAIVGPTASGKSELGLALARLLPVEIISADSRQVYRGMDIGTAKPAREELRSVRHHFIDMLDPGEEFSAGRFGEEARRVAQEIQRRGNVPLVVGGSGLYIASMVDGLFDGPGADPAIRARLEARLAREGMAALAEELRSVDPGLKVDAANPRRLVRALEVFELTGKTLSSLHRERRVETGIEARLFGLLWERGELYGRIEERCDRMLEQGLVEEVERLERSGIPMICPVLNTVGYAEVIAYRAGRLSWSAMVRLFKQNSRRYAKRQTTWFRRDPRIMWLKMGEGGGVEQAAKRVFEELGR